jgi:hypothetical protein
MTLRPAGAPDIRPILSCGSHPHEAPHLDSGNPKSTVDLGCGPLNWGENALRTLQTTVLDRSKPLGIQGILTTFWTQTEIQPNQARKLFPTLDLGCLQSSSSSSLVVAKHSRDGSSFSTRFLHFNPHKNLTAVKGNKGWLRVIKLSSSWVVFFTGSVLSVPLWLTPPLICKTNPICLLTMVRQSPIIVQ